MLVSLSKAAKLSNKSKSVLSNAIEKGRMTASKNEKGHWQIDTSELFRVYPKNNNVLKNGSSTTLKNDIVPPKEPIEHKLLEQEIKFKDEKISILEKQLQQAEDREQELRQILNQNTKLLTHYTEQEKKEEVKPTKKGWFFGR